jgi:hypothetical protein
MENTVKIHLLLSCLFNFSRKYLQHVITMIRPLLFLSRGRKEASIIPQPCTLSNHHFVPPVTLVLQLVMAVGGKL